MQPRGGQGARCAPESVLVSAELLGYALQISAVRPNVGAFTSKAVPYDPKRVASAVRRGASAALAVAMVLQDDTFVPEVHALHGLGLALQA
jgi:hypothetical protein